MCIDPQLKIDPKKYTSLSCVTFAETNSASQFKEPWCLQSDQLIVLGLLWDFLTKRKSWLSAASSFHLNTLMGRVGWFSFWSLSRASRTRHHHRLEDTEKTLWRPWHNLKHLLQDFEIPRRHATLSMMLYNSAKWKSSPVTCIFLNTNWKWSVFLSCHPSDIFAIQW